MNLVLLRLAERLTATHGVLMDNGSPWLPTLEDPWLDNKPFASCIPTGIYTCKRTNSPKFGETFEIFVHGRTFILFHAGNGPEDTSGCVLLGTEWDRSSGTTRVLRSRKAVAAFMDRLEGIDEFTLHVRNAHV